MKRTIVFVYSVAAYALFLAVFLYLIGFVGNLWVPKSVDVGPASGIAEALLVNLLLIALFGLQHSVMARPAFKRAITRHLPDAMERSTFVMAASVVLAVLMWQWRPIPVTLWQASGTVAALLWVGFASGWAIVLLSTFLINHFDLFGLRQAYLNLAQRPLTPLPFRTTLLYDVVRHPIMLGFLIAFWFTPQMTVGHLLFAAAMTAYILIGVRYEERDLVESLGPAYAAYRRTTPAFIPGMKGAAADVALGADRRGAIH